MILALLLFVVLPVVVFVATRNTIRRQRAVHAAAQAVTADRR